MSVDNVAKTALNTELLEQIAILKEQYLATGDKLESEQTTRFRMKVRPTLF